MAYTALILAILALWVSCTALYLLSRDHTALVKSVIKSLESDSGTSATLPGPLEPHITTEPTLAEELEAITTPEFVEYEREKKAIDEGRAVEWS